VKWFLGLPLPIVLLTLMLSQLCLYLHYIPVELFFLIFVLAAPASALFIKSVPEERRESAKKYFKVAKVVSIYATIIGFMYFIYSFLSIDHSSSFYKIIMFLMVIYMTLGLPFIGTCLVCMAKEKQPGASVPKHAHKPGF
jgi:Kef-type K+ transport system membrane component KefB